MKWAVLLLCLLVCVAQTFKISRVDSERVALEIEVTRLRSEAMKLQGKAFDYYVKSKVLKARLEKSRKVRCVLTGYSPDANQTDDTPFETAILEAPVPGATVAVSRDLQHWLGRRVYIAGVGVRRVNDLMNARYSKRIDIFFGTKDDAVRFGTREAEVVVLSSSPEQTVASLL